MATAAQITANQANAARSTGPRTPEGKARSARNATRHGLTAKHLVVREDEREDFETLRDSLLAELAPEGAVETVTFDDLLHAAWNLHRFRRLEADYSATPEDPASCAFLDRLGRYQARAQRAWYRALHELRRLQTNRALRFLKLADLTEEEQAEVPAITDINELAKRTGSEVTAEAVDLALKMINFETEKYTLAAFRSARAASIQSPGQTNPALRL